ncbi:hypothetical protein TNCV_1936681 [Trichonephila clavipes]|nr:hypothetical protein TNCV_1936681 [Trichonephila clavipes]
MVKQGAVIPEMWQRVDCPSFSKILRWSETRPPSVRSAPEVGHTSGQVEAVIDVPVGSREAVLRNACQFDGDRLATMKWAKDETCCFRVTAEPLHVNLLALPSFRTNETLCQGTPIRAN